ncbi:MAG: hypothetical protein HYY06_31545 [Deltaproteobacteria bacterium]|nr:hypothetical protein [Deltaproteobacteria bacterium]
MMLAIILAAVGLLCASAIVAALAARSDRFSLVVGSAGAIVACAGGTVASVAALLGGAHGRARTPFATPLGRLHVALDSLSAFFLLCVFLVSGLAALYGIGYLRGYRRRIAPAVACFNLLVASMATIVLASDAVLFLLAWEVMSVSSFFLVTFESDREDVRRAGLIYLVASHASAAVLCVLFVLFARATGSFELDAWAAPGAVPAWLANVAFLLAVVGFGAKAGFWPFHVWLPDAHPAAPSHVSAVMSGVMIKMGIYGLLRMIVTVGGSPPAWWGGLLIGLGAASGILGVLHALAQHDLKRLLAYHSVENIGIITLGIGLGLLGRSIGRPEVATLGLAGGLLHVLNHGLFKGLLFQGAGSVLHATGTREIDRLGGLYRRMPHTATTFLVGSVAISGLPPLNGFVSEWLIYVGAFRGAAAFPMAGTVGAVVVFVSLALIGGLASACFVKAFGVVFLGEARSAEAAEAHESGRPMLGAMWALAVLCAGLGLSATFGARLAAPAARLLAGPGAAVAGATLATRLSGNVVLVAAILVAMLAGLALLRKLLLAGRQVGAAPTWGCGYSEPTARMQYTARSFAQPVLAPFAMLFHRAAHVEAPAGVFPERAARDEHLEDRAQRVLFPAVRAFSAALSRLGFIERGRVQVYLAYVLLTLVALLVWQAVIGSP